LTFFSFVITLILYNFTMAKSHLKEQAIKLRRRGLSYREILRHVPVAKSTLTEWFHSVKLAEHQVQRLTEKRREAALRGARAKHEKRIIRMNEIIDKAKGEIGEISQRELWLIGTMLYWAEGSKEKEYCPGSRVGFTNSDPAMIKIFLKWLQEINNVTLLDITFDITIHELHRHRTLEILEFWANVIGCDSGMLQHIYYKKGNPKTLRKNIGVTYHGILRINVKSSSQLNRRIAGWTRGVVESIR
jgi:hypothetical protein